MSTFLVVSIPAQAHTTNPLPIARRLMDRGHEVLWYASSAYQDQLAASGATVFPYQRAHDFGGAVLEDEFPWLRKTSTISTLRRVFAEIFVGGAPERVADLQEIIAARPVDAVLTDGLTFAPGLLDELGGPVWATFGDGPLPPSGPETPPFGPGLRPMRGPLGVARNAVVGAIGRRMVFGPADRRYREIRADLGLPPPDHHVMDAMISPYLHLPGLHAGVRVPAEARAGAGALGRCVAPGPAGELGDAGMVEPGDRRDATGCAGQPGDAPSGRHRAARAGDPRPRGRGRHGGRRHRPGGAG